MLNGDMWYLQFHNIHELLYFLSYLTKHNSYCIKPQYNRFSNGINICNKNKNFQLYYHYVNNNNLDFKETY